jgi:hypothetical protein
MKSLLWKEWRENVKWVPLPTLVILGPTGLFGAYELVDVGALFYVGLVAAMFGAALGFVQVFFESSGDKRSLLLHRPLTRSQIFLAKAIVGVGLYLLALGIPFAWSVALAATPGHIYQPFHWPMALPWLADMLAGLVYYFAGMLTAQREARWYGSRCLGLAAGLFCSLLVWTVPEFWQAFGVILVSCGIVATAAWGSFSSGGAYAPQPSLAKLALAVTFLLGLSALSFTGKVLLGVWHARKTDFVSVLDRQGHVLRVFIEKGEIQSMTVTDLAGNEAPGSSGRPMTSHDFREIQSTSANGGAPKSRSYRDQPFTSYGNETKPGSEAWWYDLDRGRLVGYDKKSKRLVGSFGPDGFVRPDEEPREQFPGKLIPSLCIYYQSWANDFLVFSGGVYAVDFRTLAVRTLFVPEPGETILWASRWKDEKLDRKLTCVGTDRAVHFLDISGSPIVAVPLAYDRESYRVRLVGLLENPERYWVWYEPAGWPEVSNLETMPAYVVTYDADGREIQPRQEVPPLPGAARQIVPPTILVEPSPAQAWSGLVTPPAEAAALVGMRKHVESGVRENQGTEVPICLRFLIFTTQHFIPGVRWNTSTHPGLVFGFAGLMLFSSLVCAFACFLPARRYCFSRAAVAGWTGLGFLFGWVGVALMFALHEWPARIDCPKCRKFRVVTRDVCEHCGAAHAAPLPDGTEIIELGATTPSAVLIGL